MSKEEKNRAEALGKSELDKRLATLRQKSFKELTNLPAHETETLRSGKYDVKITTYRDDLEDERLQIVVQYYFKGWIGGWIGADGFKVSKDNVIEAMREKELYEFM